MSVLIEGMDMPETEYMDVRIFRDGTATIATGEKPYYRELKVVEVPTPHGNLVDLDAMVDKFWDGDYMELYCRDLDDIPVIVEAEAEHDSD